MISVENLTLPYAVKDISCHFPENRLIGILGANGAGKSSLLKSLAGIIQPISGKLSIDGQDAANFSPAQRSRYIAYLAQNTQVRWQLSVYDTIALGLPAPLPPQQERDKVHEVAAYFDLQPFLTKTVQHLSGGEQARVHLARCLIKNCPILLADEPIAALDPYYQIDMMQHLKKLSETSTCIVVLHHLSLAYRYCDEIILMQNGQLIDSGNTQNVMMTENLATAFAISATIDSQTKTIHSIEKLRS